jgi:hypothetical protein
MEHPEFSGTLAVGCVCAEHMENDYLGPRLRAPSEGSSPQELDKAPVADFCEGQCLSQHRRIQHSLFLANNSPALHIGASESKIGKQAALSFRAVDTWPRIQLKTIAQALQPALYFFDLSLGNGVIADNTGFKIPNLAGSEVQDSVSDLTDNLSILIEQLYFDNQIGEPVVAGICNRACSVA